ncbi:photosystem P840 reaction-center cytochrome c-551 [bacterium]|nr:photosystem P840 reaction-center cytochrome c-551 [bacterium]
MARLIVFVAVAVLVTVMVGCPKSAVQSPPMDTGRSAAPGEEPAPTVNAEPTANLEASALAPGTQMANAQALLETKCNKCHPSARAAEERRTPAEWEKVIKVMQAKKAGWISEAEAAEITKYVVANYSK